MILRTIERRRVPAALGALSAALVGACATPPAEDAVVYERVQTSEQLQPLLGRRLELDDSWLVMNADGTLEGVFGEPLAGTWEMRDGYWCRTLTAGSAGAMQRPEDCQLYEIDATGTRLRGTRERGAGDSFVYTIE